MRKLLGLLVVAGLALALSQFLIQENRKTLQDQTVTHLVLWDRPPKSLPMDRQIFDETIERFEEANPDVKVESYERTYQPEEFITVMAGGKGPDLVKVWVGAIQTLANLGFLMPVDDDIQGWSQKDYIKPVLWQSTQVGGHFYGVPADTYFLFLLYRKDLFEKAGLSPDTPPANWDQLASAAKALTRRDQGQYGLGLVPKTWYFQDFVWQAGGDMTKVQGTRVVSAFADPPAVTALSYWKDLRWKYNVLQPDLLINEPELLHLFALGKVAMVFGVADELPALISRYKIKPEVLGIAPMPAGPAGPAAHLGGQIYVVNATSSKDKQDAAWRFVQFELSPANQLWKWKRMHDLNMVIFPGAFSSATDLLNQPEFKLVQDAILTAHFEPHVNGWPQVRDLLDSDPLQEVFLDPQADPGQLLLDYAKKADRDIFSKMN